MGSLYIFLGFILYNIWINITVQYLDKYYLILGTVRGTLFIRIMRLFSVTVGPETTSFIHEREDHDGYTGISVPALFSELIRRKSETKKPYVLKEETRE